MLLGMPASTTLLDIEADGLKQKVNDSRLLIGRPHSLGEPPPKPLRWGDPTSFSAGVGVTQTELCSPWI